MKRVILDANVVISGAIAPLGRSAAILDAWRAGAFELVTCPALVEEIAETLNLPRIRKKYPLTDDQLAALLLSFGQAAHLVPGTAAVDPPPPDPDDTMLFAVAIESSAEYIVTGDAALLSFEWKGPGRVITPREFWETELRSPSTQP